MRREGSPDELLAATYYDAEWVYYRIGYYTADTFWYECARAASRLYRDDYVLKAEGRIQGFWNFSHGIAEGYARTKDPISKKAVLLIAQEAAYARDSTPEAETVPTELSREVAYALMSYLNAEYLGAERRPRYAILLNQALGHIEQWAVARTAPYVRPFMVGITAHALIMAYEKDRDPRIPPALIAAADMIWENLWDRTAEAFQYTDRQLDSGGTEPTADLNLLIAPMYGWLYRFTGEPRFLERGDAIFAGGVRKAWIEGPKQFNQNYRWSFDYVRWREDGVLKAREKVKRATHSPSKK